MSNFTTAKELGVIAFDVLRNGFHQPIVDGKCNRDEIEERITIGILSKDLDPLTQEDVNFVCDLVDDLIAEHQAS